jgi:hypothetical protein
LHGVDFGSIPFLNDWVHEAVRAGLSTYVSPRHISIDVEELLSRDKSEMPSAVPNLDNLRRPTRFFVSDPRTTMPEGIAITSIADKLESHQHQTLTLCQPVVIDPSPAPEEIRKDKGPMLRPVTELSRLALDRHALKADIPVRPVTELARLGMDRWLDSKILMKRYSDGRQDNSTG